MPNHSGTEGVLTMSLLKLVPSFSLEVFVTCVTNVGEPLVTRVACSDVPGYGGHLRSSALPME